MYKIGELEDAIVTAIATGGYSASPFNRAPDLKELEKEMTEEPAVLVVYDSSERASLRTAAKRGIDFSFQLYVMARNLRGATSAARGDVSSVGIYDVLDALRSSLIGNSLGLLAQPMIWLSEKSFSRSVRHSVYLQSWKITVFE